MHSVRESRVIEWFGKHHLRVVAVRRLPDDKGTQYRVANGKLAAVVNVYDSGTWLVQGRNPEIVPRDEQQALAL